MQEARWDNKGWAWRMKKKWTGYWTTKKGGEQQRVGTMAPLTHTSSKRSRTLGTDPVKTFFSTNSQNGRHLVKGCAKQYCLCICGHIHRHRARGTCALQTDSRGRGGTPHPQRIDSNISLIAITSLVMPIIIYCE